MNTTTAGLYGEARKAGYNPPQALRAAKIVAEFQSRDDIEIIAVAEQESPFDVYGEPEGYKDADGRYHTSGEERKELIRIYDSLGVWCVQAVVVKRCPECGHEDRKTVDCVGMCTGYENPCDWRQNWYVVDLMAAALDAVKN